MSIQSRLDSAVTTLSPSLSRIAATIRDDPATVLTSSINDLAAASGSSVASVVRLCRAIGLRGYADLRMQLASELGKENAQFGGAMAYGSDISASDSLPEAVRKIASLEMLAIEETTGALDFDSVEQAVSAIRESRRTVCFGMGASLLVAQDLTHKLFRIGRDAFCPADSHEAWSAAVLPVKPAVAVGFSHGGMTPETTRFLALAHENDFTTVAVTSNVSSSLARIADVVLGTMVRETRFRAGAMVSRIAQLAVVDALFLGVAQESFDETVEALKRTREATRSE